MRRYLTSMLAAVVAALALTVCAQAQQEESHIRNVPLPPGEVQRIIQAFTAKETQFRQALNQYGFKRDAIVQTIGWGNQITGEFRRVSRFAFDDTTGFQILPDREDISISHSRGIHESVKEADQNDLPRMILLL